MQLVAVRTVGVLGRIVIPDEVRTRLNLESGTPINIYINGKTLVISKLKPEEITDDKQRDEAVKELEKAYESVRSGDMTQDAFVKAFLHPEGPETTEEVP